MKKGDTVRFKKEFVNELYLKGLQEFDGEMTVLSVSENFNVGETARVEGRDGRRTRFATKYLEKVTKHMLRCGDVVIEDGNAIVVKGYNSSKDEYIVYNINFGRVTTDRCIMEEKINRGDAKIIHRKGEEPLARTYVDSKNKRKVISERLDEEAKGVAICCDTDEFLVENGIGISMLRMFNKDKLDIYDLTGKEREIKKGSVVKLCTYGVLMRSGRYHQAENGGLMHEGNKGVCVCLEDIEFLGVPIVVESITDDFNGVKAIKCCGHWFDIRDVEEVIS